MSHRPETEHNRSTLIWFKVVYIIDLGVEQSIDIQHRLYTLHGRTKLVLGGHFAGSPAQYFTCNKYKLYKELNDPKFWTITIFHSISQDSHFKL